MKRFLGIILGSFLIFAGLPNVLAEEATKQLEFIPLSNTTTLESNSHATMLAGDEEDKYQFTLESNKKVEFLLDSKDKVVSFTLKNENGVSLLTMHNDVTNDVLTDEIGLPSGTYTIGVYRRYSHEGNIPYELKIKAIENNYYEIEPNGAIEKANPILLNTTYTANNNMLFTGWDTTYEEDYYKFEIPLRGKYGFKFSGPGASHVYILDQSRKKSIQTDNDVAILDPGIYYLRIYSSNTHYDNMPYSFEINNIKYKDVGLDNWAVKEIAYLSDFGYIYGFSDGTFKPTKNVTKSEAAAMVVRALGIDINNRPAPSFRDVSKKHWSYKPIAALVDEGIYPNGTSFNPSKPLTREEMAMILVNAYDLKGTYSKTYKDVSNKRWSYKYISTLAANNITIGYNDETFRPLNPLTRAQFSVFLSRILDERYKQ